MWSDEEIYQELLNVSNIDDEACSLDHQDAVRLMRRMRDEMQAELQKVQIQLYDTLQAQEKLLEQKYEMADRIGELVDQNRNTQALVDLLSRPDVSLYVGDYVMVHGDQCWHVGSINEFGGGNSVYSGDLSGAIEVLRKAAGDEN